MLHLTTSNNLSVLHHCIIFLSIFLSLTICLESNKNAQQREPSSSCVGHLVKEGKCNVQPNDC